MAYATLTAKIPAYQLDFIDELVASGKAADRSSAIRGIIEAFMKEGCEDMPAVPKREKVAKDRTPKKQRAAQITAAESCAAAKDPAEETEEFSENSEGLSAGSSEDPSADHERSGSEIIVKPASPNRKKTEPQTLEESFDKVIEESKRNASNPSFFKKNKPDFTGWTEEQIREYRRSFPEAFDD